jgi:hypothetical protein
VPQGTCLSAGDDKERLGEKCLDEVEPVECHHVAEAGRQHLVRSIFMLAAWRLVVVGGFLQVPGCGAISNGGDVRPVDRVGTAYFSRPLRGDGF